MKLFPDVEIWAESYSALGWITTLQLSSELLKKISNIPFLLHGLQQITKSQTIFHTTTFMLARRGELKVRVVAFMITIRPPSESGNERVWVWSLKNDRQPITSVQCREVRWVGRLNEKIYYDDNWYDDN